MSEQHINTDFQMINTYAELNKFDAVVVSMIQMAPNPGITVGGVLSMSASFGIRCRFLRPTPRLPYRHGSLPNHFALPCLQLEDCEPVAEVTVFLH
jgi:hypothetical protein